MLKIMDFEMENNFEDIGFKQYVFKYDFRMANDFEDIGIEQYFKMANNFEDIGIEQYVFKYCFMRSCGRVSYQLRFRLGIILATVLTRDLN